MTKILKSDELVIDITNEELENYGGEIIGLLFEGEAKYLTEKVLTKLKNITMLRLQIKDNFDYQKIANLINLQYLGLVLAWVGGDHDFSYLSQLPYLKSLSIYDYCGGIEDQLPMMLSLEELTFGWCFEMHHATGIKDTEEAKLLLDHFAYIIPRTRYYIHKDLPQVCPNLKVLRMGQNKLDDAGIENILQLSKLKVLDLQGTGVESEGIIKLLDNLKDLETLEMSIYASDWPSLIAIKNCKQLKKYRGGVRLSLIILHNE